jgi:hypothetical protein
MGLIKNRIEVLSIHIPKTGGSSFQKTLQQLYGEDSFQRLDFTVREAGGRPNMKATNRTSQELLDRIDSRGELPSDIRVLHGHFHYEDFTRFFELDSGTRVVTWLREPVRRIVSNYNYILSTFHRETELTPRSEQHFKRLVKSLLEFARHPRDVHLYADYLRGRDLSEYDFVGVMEAYEDELIRLGKILGVTEIPQFNVNQARQKAPALDRDQELALVALYKENLEIYKKALDIKG